MQCAIDTENGSYNLIGNISPSMGRVNGLSGTPDGTLYAIAGKCLNSFYLLTINITNGEATNIGQIKGVSCGIDLAYDTNNDMIYVIDLVTNSLFMVDPLTAASTLIGRTGIIANYAQGMDFEEESGILFWAAYNNDTLQGELRVIDTETGASTLVGAFPYGSEVDCLAFPTGGISDVPWLTEDITSGELLPNSSSQINLTINPAGLNESGDYAAALRIKQDTPYKYSDIPIVLHLTVLDDHGAINGVIKGLEACDVNPTPIESATVNFKQNGDIVYTTTTLADGYYSYSMPVGSYDIEVIAEGFVSQTITDVEILSKTTISRNFELRRSEPCLYVDPVQLITSIFTGQDAAQILKINNTGAADANIGLEEINTFMAGQKNIFTMPLITLNDNSYDVPWLSEEPMECMVPADGSVNITITFDPSGLDVGEYHATLRVKSLTIPGIDVPVVLHVLEYPKLYLPMIAK